jgi:uncharacterized protein (TIGR02466 family)
MTEFFIGQIPLVNFVWDEYNLHEESLKLQIKQDYKQNTIESDISPQAKRNMWESNFLYLESNEVFAPLKHWLLNTCEQYVNNKNNANYKFIIEDSWAHVTSKNGMHTPHYHDNSTWSGIFYLTDNTSGPNNWYLPYYIERKPGLDFASDRFSVLPKKGNLLLFPSCILHDAAPLESDEERIVIAFNANCI